MALGVYLRNDKFPLFRLLSNSGKAYNYHELFFRILDFATLHSNASSMASQVSLTADLSAIEFQNIVHLIFGHYIGKFIKSGNGKLISTLPRANPFMHAFFFI